MNVNSRQATLRRAASPARFSAMVRDLAKGPQSLQAHISEQTSRAGKLWGGSTITEEILLKEGSAQRQAANTTKIRQTGKPSDPRTTRDKCESLH